MSISFVAIDFETANSFRGSPCSIGLVKVIDGEPKEKYSKIFRPPKGYDNFDSWNVAIHGISASMVKNEPRFNEIWPEILEFIGDLPLVAHNAGFDLGVLREALTFSNLDWPSVEYVCTMVLGRRAYSIPSYTLPYVAEAAGILWDEANHHDAEYDALIAAKIFLSIANSNELSTIEEVLEKFGIKKGVLSVSNWAGCQSKFVSKWASKSLKISEVEINSDADPDHPLFGKKVVFTGELHSFTRTVAWQEVAKKGGVPRDTIAKDTNILVVGEQTPMKLRPGVNQSKKFEKAALLKANGQQIEVMTERDFLTLLEVSEGTLAEVHFLKQQTD